MEEIQNNQSISEQNKNFFGRHIIVISIVLILMLLYIGFFVTTLFFNRIASSPAVSMVYSGAQNEQSTQNESINNSVTEKDINRLMGNFMLQLQSGSFDQALITYNELLTITNNHPIFTAQKVIDQKKFVSLISIEKEINQEDNITKKSKLLIEKGELEYRIGSDLYYQYPQEYGVVVYYYFMRAMRSFDESMGLSDSALAHRYKGVLILDLGKPLVNMAILELQKSIAMDGSDVIAFYKLGNAQKGLQEYNSAITTYLSGLALDQDHELILNNLGITYFEHGDRNKGYEIYNSLLAKCVKYCNLVNYNLAHELGNESLVKDYQKILSLYDKAIAYAKLKGEVYRNAYFQKGKIYFYQAQFPEALTQFILSLNDPNDKKTDDNVFNQNLQDESSYYYIVKTYVSLGKNDLAKKYLNIGLLKFPKDKDLLSLKNSINL